MASAKPQQILQLNPASEIVFEGPFDKVVTSYLELKNPSNERVCFKVKTTAPRRYCVRPNSGIVGPAGKQRIAIMLQPIEHDSQSERSKHKFMVQSTIMANEDTNLDEVWKSAQQEDIMDSKLRCVFQASGDNTQSATTTTTSSSPSGNPTSESIHKINSITASTTQAESANQPTLSQKSASGSNESNQNKTNKVASPGDGLMRTEAVTSTPTRSSPRAMAANVSSTMDQQQEFHYHNLRRHDKSVASSHNLSTSFLQPMSDDHKVVLVSLVMLIIGVILGKYII